MSADIEKLAGEFKGDQFKHLRAFLNANAQLARQLGAPEHFDNGQRTSVPKAEGVTEFKLDTPDAVTNTFGRIWEARGKLIGVTFDIAQCPLSEKELKEREKRNIRVGVLPQAVATQETRHLLGEMFPKMQSHSVQEGNSVTNDENPSGYFDYEAAIDAPYLDTKEKELMERIKKDGRTILNLNQYIVAGQDSKLFTGKYLDEVSTWVRLASRGGGRMVVAGFGGDGSLRVASGLRADNHHSLLGGRSSGVKKA
ncbi:MAG: hypothetical protein AAB512_00180 [Patescibacteria group bacterium]